MNINNSCLFVNNNYVKFNLISNRSWTIQSFMFNICSYNSYITVMVANSQHLRTLLCINFVWFVSSNAYQDWYWLTHCSLFLKSCILPLFFKSCILYPQAFVILHPLSYVLFNLILFFYYFNLFINYECNFWYVACFYCLSGLDK